MVNWKLPKNVSEVRSFLGLAGYYRKFVEGFSKIVAPLTKLTRKDVNYDWVDACQHSFEELKGRFTSTPVLALPNGRDGFVVYCHTPIPSPTQLADPNRVRGARPYTGTLTCFFFFFFFLSESKYHIHIKRTTTRVVSIKSIHI